MPRTQSVSFEIIASSRSSGSPATDARALFDHAAGREQRTLPRALVAEAVELCGRLPLAIRITAAWLRSHPTWGLADLLTRLRDQDHRLAELADPDADGRSVAAALEVSYQQLPAAQQRLYQLLGLHPGPDLDPYAAAALLDADPDQARRLLDQLLDAHLLQEPNPGRYTCHDLIRTHAAQLATAPGPRWRRSWRTRGWRAALTRLLDYYRSMASAAMDGIYPYERDRRPRVPSARTRGPELPGSAAATAWLDTELRNLLAAARYAGGNGWPEHTCQLSAILHRHLRTRGQYQEAQALHEQALATGRRVGELDSLLGLARVHQVQGRYQPAFDTFAAAHDIARRTGDRTGQLSALIGLGWVNAEQGWYAEALDRFEQALELARRTGDRNGELNALRGLGHIHLAQGRHRQAFDALDAALEIARRTRNRNGELGALTSLGHIHRHERRPAQAADSYRAALDLARDAGHRNWQFEALQGLGRLHHGIGHQQLAVEHHQQALELATELGQPVDRSRAHDGLAHAHRALGQHSTAHRHWRSALDILDDLGTDHTEEPEVSTSTIRAHLAASDQDGAGVPGG